MKELELDKILDLISNNNIKNICSEFVEKQQEHKSYNIFNIVSDKYYKEDFHSDIIYSFLNKDEMHNAGDNYLIKFIDYIKRIKKSTSFSSEDFKNSSVTREKGRIDILITDEESKKAVIIENKINNAVDQDRQLPGYYDYVTSNGYEVVTIVYLSLHGQKKYDNQSWKSGDEEKIKPVYLQIAAYKDDPDDLFNGWLKPCIDITKDDDAKSVLRQYSQLFLKLKNQLFMNKTLDQFFKEIAIGNNYETLLSIKKLADHLPEYIANRIKNKFENNHEPFSRLNVQGSKSQFLDAKIKDRDYIIDIHCSLEGYKMSFWEKEYQKNGVENVEKLLNEIQYKNDFYDNQNSEFQLKEKYKFPEGENEFFDFIKKFLSKLKHYQLNNDNSATL